MFQQKIPRNNRLVYSSPELNIDCSYVVSRTHETAFNAHELIPARSVAPVNAPAYRAGMRSPSWIDYDIRYSLNDCLVVDKETQLPECPGTMVIPLCLPNRYTVSDPFEIFTGNRPASVFGFCYQFPGNAVINMTHEPSFSPGEFPEMPFCTFSPSGLKSGSESDIPLPDFFDLGAAVHFTITVNSEIDNTKIYSKNSYGVEFGRFRSFNNNCKIKYTITKKEISLTSDPVQTGFLVLPDANRYNLPAFECQDGDRFKLSPGKDTLVINNCSFRQKFGFDRLIPFVCFNYFCNRTYGVLRRKTEYIPNIVIDKLLKFDFVDAPPLEGNICNVVASLVEPVHGLKQRVILFLGSIELNHQRLQHDIDNSVQCINNLLLGRRGTLLPKLESLGVRYPCTQEDVMFQKEGAKLVLLPAEIKPKTSS